MDANGKDHRPQTTDQERPQTTDHGRKSMDDGSILHAVAFT